MARKTRVFISDMPQHIMLKSISDITLFQDQDDYVMFIAILQDLVDTTDNAIHAYLLMPSYFEFLVTPKNEQSLPKLMQSLGSQYVRYFNKKYNRSGTLWEGRYKSSLLQAEAYLFDVMISIEKKVSLKYNFCSVKKNLFCKQDKIITYHKLYKELGFTDKQRCEEYDALFHQRPSKEVSKFIELSLEKQHITGTSEFIQQLEYMVGMTLSAKGRGRPKKQTQHKRKNMYKNLVILDKESHKDLKMGALENLNFAKESAYVPVVANEVALVGNAFPVVFSADENPSLIALTSLGGDSLAINEEGKWITSYVPSFLRKYPFALASTKEDSNQKVILIDEKAPLFSKSKGKQLFKKDGEQSDLLKHAVDFLTSHENQAVVTNNVAKLVAQSGILEDREISVGEGEEKKVLVNGFKVVNREKLHALSDDILADWVRKGIITLIDAHLESLEHIETLFKLTMQKQNIA